MQPIEIPPGVVSAPTKSSRSGNWREVNHMRWVDQRLTPVGGWSRIDNTALPSKLRKMHTWIDYSGVRRTAYLCEGHLLVDSGSGPVDVSPEIAIVMPNQDVAQGGYGQEMYSADLYGTPRPPSFTRKEITPIYCIDNWGETLIAMTSTDGRLLMWNPNTPTTKAAAVQNAPISNRCFVVTPERHVMLFGMAGDFRKFGWCNQEIITDWNFATVDGSAGFYDLEPASPIVTATNTADGVLFFCANNKSFIVRYAGLPFVYTYEEVSEVGGPISPASLVETPVGTMFVDLNGFWMFTAGSMQPIQCPVWSWVHDRYRDFSSRYEATFVHLTKFSEVWWFFGTTNETKTTHYVSYNYRDGWWSMGQLSRSCGFSSTYFSLPRMSDGEFVYEHENGWVYPNENSPWAETFPLNVSSGALLSTFDRMLVDAEGDFSRLDFTLDYNTKRVGETRKTAVRTIGPNGYVGFRATGRDFRLRVATRSGYGSNWTIGQPLVDIKTRGKK